MLWTSYKPISLGMVFDFFDLLLTSGVCGTSRGIPCTLQGPLSERMCSFWGMFLASWTGPLGVRDLFC